MNLLLGFIRAADDPVSVLQCCRFTRTVILLNTDDVNQRSGIHASYLMM